MVSTLNIDLENTTITKTSIALAELVEKGADQDLLRDLVTQVVKRLMAMDVENLYGAPYGERNAERQKKPQWLSRTTEGNPRRQYRAQNPEGAYRQLLSGLLGTKTNRREGADRRHLGGLTARRLGPLGRRPSQGSGHERDFQEACFDLVRCD